MWPSPVEYTYNAKVLRIIDGDTYEVEVDLGFRMATRLPLRLAHVDTPERHTVPGRTVIAQVHALLDPLPSSVVVVTHKSADKYGRYLADVLIDGIDLATTLVNEGHAVPYEGGTKL
jgi:micrococcal nuclease